MKRANSQAHSMAAYWLAEARKRQALANAIQAAAGLDPVRRAQASTLRLEAAALLRMAAERPR